MKAHGVSCHVRSRASSGNDLIGVFGALKSVKSVV